MLRGEHLAGAADAGLHFIEYQKNSVPIAELAQALQESVRRHEIPSLALNRFDENCSHFARGNVVHEQNLFDVPQNRAPLIHARKQRPIVVGVRHVGHPRHAGEEAFLLRVLAGGEGQRAHGSAVETAQKADEPAAARGEARQFQGRFHALGPRLREEAHRRLLHGRQFIEALRQPDLSLMPVIGGNMQEFIRGLLDGLDHGRMAVPGAANGDARGKVQEAVAVDIPDFSPLAVRHHEGVVARIGRRDDERVARQQLARLRTRQIGFDVWFSHGALRIL